MSAPLPIWSEQRALPGIRAAVTEVRSPAVAEDPVPAPVPDQLCFGTEQPVLAPAPLPARQLPLVADPPLWEAEPAQPSPANHRRERTRRLKSNALSPGQMSLF